MKAPVAQGGDFKIAPAGTHPAVLVHLVDLGTQEGEFEGKVTHSRKIRMQFELHSDEAMTDDGKPMVIGREFTLSSYETARLRQFIEGWRSQAFTEEEAANFDYRVMLGKPCILNISHKKSGNGRTYANIVSASKLMKGMAPPVQVNNNVYFYMGTEDTAFAEYDKDIFNGLQNWLKDKIQKSPEYAKATGQYVEDQTPPALTRAPMQISNDVPFDDDIPF